MKKKEQVLGGGRETGVFLTKSDMAQLIEVIAKAKAKDNLVKKVGVKVVGGGTTINAPTLGYMSIRDFVEKLARAYNMPEGKFYGINKKGEFIEWVSLDELGQPTN